MRKLGYRGSALAVTLIIMGIVLAAALSVATISVKERKASIQSNKSNRAYQTADKGVEYVLGIIFDELAANTTNPDYRVDDVNWNSYGCPCVYDSAIGERVLNCDSRKFKAELFNVTYVSTNPVITNSDHVDCNDGSFNLKDIDMIKTFGRDPSSETERFVEADVPMLPQQ